MPNIPDPQHVVDTVKTTTGWYNVIASFGTFATVFAALLGGIAAVVRYGPKWREVAIVKHSADITALTDRQNILEAKLEKALEAVDAAREKAREIERNAEARVHNVELQLRSALNACRVLLNYVEREHSDAPEVSLAKELLAIAVTPDMGINVGIDKIVAKMSGSKGNEL